MQSCNHGGMLANAASQPVADGESESRTVNVIARVPGPVHRRLRRATVEQGTSINQVVNDLILGWLEENAPEGGGVAR